MVNKECSLDRIPNCSRCGMRGVFRRSFLLQMLEYRLFGLEIDPEIELRCTTFEWIDRLVSTSAAWSYFPLYHQPSPSLPSWPSISLSRFR